ncbi:hypothetical protein HN51_016448 [Arachis hypogaea]
MPKNSTNVAVEVVDKALIQKVLDIVQNTEVRTTVMENNMQPFEKCQLNIERSFTDLHNSLTHVKGGAKTLTTRILRTNTQAMSIPLQAQLIDTSVFNSHEKGKAIVGECRGGMFDIIVPNPPDFDDDVIIYEQRSTPRPKARLANSKSLLARKLHWSSRIPKVRISQTVARSSPVIRSTEMILQNRCFSHSVQFVVDDVRPRPMKLPKMEPIDNDSVPYLAEIPTQRLVLLMGGCVNN